MTDTATPSSAPAATPTATTPSTAPKEKVKIASLSNGGGFSLDTFNAAMGKETPSVTDDEAFEPDVDEDAGELKTPAKEEEADEEDTDEVEDSADEDEESDEDLGDLEEVSASTKKGIKAFTKDGKPLTLPPDLEIEQMVDGEKRKINLREHLNVVAGEMTVESRIGKVASFREEVEQRRKEIEGVHSRFMNDVNTVIELSKEGKPDLAICFLAELNKVSPIQMKKQFLQAIVAEAAKFEGKSEVEIDNYYLNLENKWRLRKEEKAREESTKRSKAESFNQLIASELKKENISKEEFVAANQEVRKEQQLTGLEPEAVLDIVIERALLKKHVGMARSAIEAVDPKLAQNRKILELLLEHTHPNKFSVEEMAEVLRTYLGKATTRIASSLSKKVQHKKVQAKSEKQNEAGKTKTYRSQGDLARAFGL